MIFTNLGEKIKKNKMGGTCSAYGEEEKVHIGSWWGDLLEGYHMEDPDIDGGMILKWICKKWGWRH